MPLSAFARWTTVPVQPLAISHQGQFPAVTISFNLAPGVALGEATDAVPKAVARVEAAARHCDEVPGQCAGIPGLAGLDALCSSLAALVVVYLVLGILYESYVHPFTILSTLPSAGVGALATLMLFASISVSSR